jgi:ubiquinone/menaquinone biosynthesis C-methylase UbiE
LEKPRRHDGVTRGVEGENFEVLDFDRLWFGRERTHSVEASLLDQVLAGSRRRRILEVGVGIGRLTPILVERSIEYVGVDIVPSFLRRARGKFKQETRNRWVVADIRNPPFSEAAFDTAVMIRVYNFLADPESVLAGIRRLLAPGGNLVLTYNPHPSIGTLIDDLKVGLHQEWRSHFEPMTFSRKEVVKVRPSILTAFAPTRIRFRRTVTQAGFQITSELGVGLEDNRLFGGFPTDLFVQVGRTFGSMGGFPMYLVTATGGVPNLNGLPDLDTILVCPRCRATLDSIGPEERESIGCQNCGAKFGHNEGVLDLRWPRPFGQRE